MFPIIVGLPILHDEPQCHRISERFLVAVAVWHTQLDGDNLSKCFANGLTNAVSQWEYDPFDVAIAEC